MKLQIRIWMAAGFAMLPLCLSGCFHFIQKGIHIPIEEASAITATIYNRPDKGADIPAFKLPPSFHSRLINLLKKSTPHRSEIDWAVLGELRITVNAGIVSLQLFSAGNKVVFHIDGGAYEMNGLKKLILLIEEAMRAEN
ncbi:MAG: hypothetical protein HN758_16265 [Verrucomicrobia bacterium]|nr:hypothetical protein [Verrucomicrobiota bacterium]